MTRGKHGERAGWTGGQRHQRKVGDPEKGREATRQKDAWKKGAKQEAGAQGQHKIARGYLPSPVYSAHFIADPALRAPVARYLDGERPAVAAEIDAISAELSPFRRPD